MCVPVSTATLVFTQLLRSACCIGWVGGLCFWVCFSVFLCIFLKCKQMYANTKTRPESDIIHLSLFTCENYLWMRPRFLHNTIIYREEPWIQGLGFKDSRTQVKTIKEQGMMIPGTSRLTLVLELRLNGLPLFYQASDTAWWTRDSTELELYLTLLHGAGGGNRTPESWILSRYICTCIKLGMTPQRTGVQYGRPGQYGNNCESWKLSFEFELWVLCCFMTPGLSKDIQCHVWPYSVLCLQITRYQATHKVGCQPGDCRWPLVLPRGFMWVSMG